MDYDEVPDERLLAAAIGGTSSAFGMLFTRHRDRVFRHVLRLASTPSDAEDLVGLTFAEAWRKREHVRIVDSSMLPWLLLTATNLARNSSRAGRRHRLFLSRLPAPQPEPDHAETTIDAMQIRQRAQSVRSAFDRLSARDQRVLTLCILEELSTSAVAEALDVPMGTVKSRLFRARSRLTG
ncbi:MAG: RNA polymerase sigma factor, partial [Cryobacterium sp.]